MLYYLICKELVFKTMKINVEKLVNKDLPKKLKTT